MSVPPPPLVQFSVLYRLHHNASSVTARNSLSAHRLSDSLSASASLCTASPAIRETAADPPCLEYATPTKHATHLTSTPLHPYGSGTPLSQPSASPARSPSAMVNGTPVLLASSSTSSLPLLSTMDKRELSKVVVRDAVYARVLDLVPGRQQVQTAVWTLSPHVIQVDGAVAVCAMPADVPSAHTLAAADDRGHTYSLSAHNCADVRRVVHERLRELVGDANLFAAVLTPYLGELGSQGEIVQASVDGVPC